jgi:hypothetical protein
MHATSHRTLGSMQPAGQAANSASQVVVHITSPGAQARWHLRHVRWQA